MTPYVSDAGSQLWSHLCGGDHHVGLQWGEVSAGIADQRLPEDWRDRTLVDSRRWVDRVDARGTDGRKQSNQIGLPCACAGTARVVTMHQSEGWSGDARSRISGG